LFGQTQVVTGPDATTAVAAQRFGHTQVSYSAMTGAAAVLQVLGHTHGRNWATATGAGVAVRNVARIKVIMVPSSFFYDCEDRVSLRGASSEDVGQNWILIGVT